MHSNYLLPPAFRKVGIILLIPFLSLGAMVIFEEFSFDFLTFLNFRSDATSKDLFIGRDENFTNELAIIGTLLSLFFIAFSREKQEDEFIFKTRLESLLWATYINILLMILVTLAVYGINYYMVITNMIFVLMLIFIIRFNFILYWQPRFKSGKGERDEK